MAGYKILFRSSVENDFRNIPKPDIKKILQTIEKLTDDPRSPGSEKLTGQERYRIRQDSYRILYSILARELIVCVVKIGHRKDIYR